RTLLVLPRNISRQNQQSAAESGGKVVHRLQLSTDSAQRAPDASRQIDDEGMLDPGPPIALEDIILSREVVTAGERTALYRRIARGELVRLVPGAYLDADRWRAVWAEEQHRAVLRASAALHPHRVFGGQSA